MSVDPVTIGIVGAGNRGQRHASQYANVDGIDVRAVADIDEGAATALADEYDIDSVYGDYRELLDDDIDAISICVHNNLHAPIAIDAFETGKHVFCEKPIAGSYADAKRMMEAAEAKGRHLGVQNERLFEPETRAAKRLVDHDELGDVSYARAVFTRRRGRPYIDGYGTPSFVRKEVAGGGSVFDIGTYAIGRMLYLLGSPSIARVSGRTWDFTDDQFEPEQVGDHASMYRERLDEVEYSVEDAGFGTVRFDDGTTLDARTAWHMYVPDEPELLVGSTGGVQFDPFELRTTVADYEATVDVDVEGYEGRQALLGSETGYDFDNRPNQFAHWVDTIRGDVEPIPTGRIALDSMLIMEGIYQSAAADQELSAEEVADGSESTAFDP